MKKSIVIISVLVFFFSCADKERAKFNKIKQLNSIEEFKKFISENKESNYADSARFIIQTIEFRNSNNIEELNSFLEKYPKSDFTNQVSQKIETIKKEEAKKKENEYKRKKEEIKKLRKEKRRNSWFVASECIMNYFRAGMKWRMTDMQKIKMTDILSKKLPAELNMEGNTMNHKLARKICSSYKITRSVRQMSASDFKRTFYENTQLRPIWDMVFSAYKKSK